MAVAALKARLGPLLSMLVMQARSLQCIRIQVMFTWLQAVVMEDDGIIHVHTSLDSSEEMVSHVKVPSHVLLTDQVRDR